ncbi:MAG: hypothetical protein HQL22_04685 [Candidatus Omnitrophica bacterium]|nr:hypothetical protein [Candidatus Omnitrophota bacterium]
MSFKVDELTRSRTTRCRHDSKCLEVEGCPGCDVTEAVSEGLIFVKPRPANMDCPYILSYASYYICRCPTRCEIYRKYKE